MTQLLQDVFVVENLQILTEGTNKDTMKIKGVFGRCNEKNNNGRIYPTSVLEGQLNKVQPLISERRLCGELDHPQNDTVRLSNASHLITKLEMKGNELVGEAEILKTPAGLTAKALVEGGVKIGISSRGMGTLSEDAKGDKIVNEDFRLVTFDLVADPSTRGAFPGLSESTQSQFVRESQTKLEKEQNFITLLQSKLRDSYDPWIEEATKKKKSKKKGPTDDGDGMDPVGQGDADIDNDGDTDSSDAYLKKRRKAIGKAMKAEGTYYRIGSILAEALQDEVDSARSRFSPAEIPSSRTASGDGPGFLARSRIRAGKRAEAKGDVQAAKIRAKGSISVGRMQQKAQQRADAGEPVTGGERAAAAAGKAARGAASAAGKAARGAASAAGMAGRGVKSAIGKGISAASAKKPQAQAKKPGISDEEKFQRKALGQADQKKATADVASRAKKGAGGQFGAGVGRSDKADMQKAIARRERKTGKKVNLTKQQALDLSHRAYRQLGLHLAEAMGIVEMKDKTPEEKRATIDRARKSAFQAAHRGEGRRSKAEINRAAMRRENQVGSQGGEAAAAAQDETP